MQRLAEASVPTVVDPKASLSAYQGAALLKPNLREAEALSGISIRNTEDLNRAGQAIRKRIGGGPVVKTHASQAYASDAATAGMFRDLCARLEIEPQDFVSRSDLPCGSTIGPITAARVGIRTVDVGNPMLSMHSCREMAGSADVHPMIRILTEFLRADPATQTDRPTA